MGMKTKNKKTIFICQISGSVLKIAKCIADSSSRMKVSDVAVEVLSSDSDDKGLIEKSSRAFKELGYNRNPIIVSLPRIQATCRQLRLPSQSPQEIENIIRLQRGAYLPYPAEELVTAYEVISVDSQGYSHLNLTIAQKDVISRYVQLFSSFKPAAFCVVLSSYGLSRLYSYLNPGNAASVTLIAIDFGHAELAVTANKKLLFSRYFNLDITKSDWQNSFIDEFNKSRDVYRKEIPGEMPDKVIILGGGKTTEEAAEALREKVGLSAQTLPYYQALTCEYSADKIPSDGYSFAGIAGLGAGDIEESLYLLPREIKEKNRILAQRKERLHMILLLAALIAVWILALTRNLDNKSRYLGLLQAEMSKIAQQAQPLEAMDKKIRMLESRSAKEALNLVLLPELYKTVPSQVYLNNLACEEESKITLRGYAPELNSVLAFVSKLESSAVLRDFDVKIKYATKRKTSKGEFIDFEISGSKLK